MSSHAREGAEVHFLVFSASLRAESLNTRLAALAANVLESHGGHVHRASMGDFDAPSFNSDDQARDGYPSGAVEFRRQLERCDAFVISAPEYNASMPGHLKNAIDWVSRFSPQPLNERHGLLMSASPSMSGGNRGLWALRIPFEHLGARIYPDMFSLAQADQAFDNQGHLANEELSRRFDNNIESFMSLVEASVHYPCAKKAWVEFLGEQPSLAGDRVE